MEVQGKLTVAQYQQLAKRTCPDIGHQSYNLLHMEMGLYTEAAGELLDCYKKWLAYGKELDMINISEEIADCMWYLANEASMNDYIFDKDYIPNAGTAVYTGEVSMVIFEILDFLRRRAGGHFLRYTDMVDHMYRISILAGVDFFQGLENNIRKLQIRYPEKFTQESALNRNLEEERKELYNIV